jgi:hypothetical protein
MICHNRLQFTIPDCEADTLFRDLKHIIPDGRAIVGTTRAPDRIDSIILIVLTDDPDIEFMLRLKYAGCELFTTRF